MITQNKPYLNAIANLIPVIKEKYKNRKSIQPSINSLKKYQTINYTKGNHKIGTDTLIFNMGMGEQCPSDILGLCSVSKECYDKKSTALYQSSFVFKKISSFQWIHWSKEEYITQLIETIFKHKKSIKYIRFNEGGDFYSKDCIYKLAYIGKIVKQFFPHIKIYTYTHRSDLLEYFECLPDNVTVNGSNFMVHNNYHVSRNTFKKDKKALARKRMVCLDDCSICHLCKVRHGKKILQTIH